MRFAIFLLLALTTLSVSAQDTFTYQLPPKELADLICGESTDEVFVNSQGTWAIIAERPSCPPIEDVAQPLKSIGGLNFNPNNFASAVVDFFRSIRLKEIASGRVHSIIGLPIPLRASDISWSPDGKNIAFIQTGGARVDLFKIDTAAHRAARVNQRPSNTVLGRFGANTSLYAWADAGAIVYRAATNKSTDAPIAGPPTGPIVRESLGKAASDLAYRNLIRSPYDEKVFDFFATSQLIRNQNGKETRVGPPAVYDEFQLSPDGKYVLTTTLEKPYAKLSLYHGFSRRVSIFDMQGRELRELAALPAREQRTPADAATLPHDFDWRSDKPATITWVRRADPKAVSETIYALQPPFKAPGQELFKTQLPFQSVIWGSDSVALVREADRQRIRLNWYNPETSVTSPLIEWGRDFRNHPGNPVTIKNAFGRQVAYVGESGREILLSGPGNALSGNIPFVSKLSLENRKAEIVWKSQNERSERFVSLTRSGGLFVSEPSMKSQATYYINDFRKSDPTRREVARTNNTQPRVKGLLMQTVNYKRADGVEISGTVYLPKGYDPSKDGALPVLIWSYPRRYSSLDEYKTEDSTERNVTDLEVLNWENPAIWVTQGYTVFQTSMPILPGPKGENGNDTFSSQLRMDAEAAIKKLADMKVGDPRRVAIAGHSYGGSMTALLLAHTDLFKAGIAFSGGFNRTLSPFGFQDETRSYWQAPNVYQDTSAFLYADRIKEALLLIHGDSDDVPGTAVQESEALFKAVQGNGGTVRFVTLPNEGHAFTAKESLLHLLWEQARWLDRYVKNADKGETQ